MKKRKDKSQVEEVFSALGAAASNKAAKLYPATDAAILAVKQELRAGHARARKLLAESRAKHTRADYARIKKIMAQLQARKQAKSGAKPKQGGAAQILKD